MNPSLSENSAQSYSNNSSELDNMLKDQLIGGFDNVRNDDDLGANDKTEKNGTNQKITDFFKQVSSDRKKQKYPVWFKYATNVHVIHFLLCLLICSSIIVVLYLLRPFFILTKNKSNNEQTFSNRTTMCDDIDQQDRVSLKRLALIFGVSFCIVYGVPNVIHIKNKFKKR